VIDLERVILWVVLALLMVALGVFAYGVYTGRLAPIHFITEPISHDRELVCLTRHIHPATDGGYVITLVCPEIVLP